MNVITLTPPYGSLIMLAQRFPTLGKRIETRSWHTSYRGRLLIHQGSNLKPVGGMQGLLKLCGSQPFFDVLMHIVPGYNRYCDRDAIVAALPMGKIIGSVELRDCRIIGVELNGVPTIAADDMISFTPILGNERAFGDYQAGRWAWLCANPKELPEPIPARGYPGLWDYEGVL